MNRAIHVRELGGAEVLRLEDHDPGSPGEGTLLVRVVACGVNFIDVYFRTGLYPRLSVLFSGPPLSHWPSPPGSRPSSHSGYDNLRQRISLCFGGEITQHPHLDASTPPLHLGTSSP